MITAASEVYRLLEQARDNAYTLPADFSGFEADLEVYLAESWHKGKVLIRSAQDIDLHLLEDLQAWPRRELSSIVAHRTYRSFAQSEGQYPLRVQAQSPLGTAIAVEDSMHSVLWVHDQQIVMVERNLPETSFRILVHSHRAAGDKQLPASFTVTYRQNGTIHSVESYSDSYCFVSGVFLPQTRQVVRQDQMGLSIRVLRLSNHQLI
jgi:hypothetical protein